MLYAEVDFFLKRLMKDGIEEFELNNVMSSGFSLRITDVFHPQCQEKLLLMETECNDMNKTSHTNHGM